MVQIPRQGFRPRILPSHGERQRRFQLHTLTARLQLERRLDILSRFRQVAEGGFAQGLVVLPDRPIFLAIGPHRGFNRHPGQLPRLIQMAGISLCVGLERQPEMLRIRLAAKPLGLLLHALRILRQ